MSESQNQNDDNHLGHRVRVLENWRSFVEGQNINFRLQKVEAVVFKAMLAVGALAFIGAMLGPLVEKLLFGAP